MNFWNKLKNKEEINKLALFLWTDEQQEFLDRTELVRISKEKYFKETVLQNLSKQELENEKKYNFLLEKSIIFSKMRIEDRLAILLLTDVDQKKYVQLLIIIRKFLDWEIESNWESDDIIKEHELLLKKAKSRYLHRSLL